MVTNRNTSIFATAHQLFNVRDGVFFNDNLGNQIIPTINIQQHTSIVRSGSTSTSNVTLFTTPLDKDFFLTACTVSLAKDATSDLATGTPCGISMTVGGTASAILPISSLTLTAQNTFVTLNLERPVKVDRNTSISLVKGATTVGTCVVGGSICGYLSDTLQY